MKLLQIMVMDDSQFSGYLKLLILKFYDNDFKWLWLVGSAHLVPTIVSCRIALYNWMMMTIIISWIQLCRSQTCLGMMTEQQPMELLSKNLLLTHSAEIRFKVSHRLYPQSNQLIITFFGIET